MALPKIEFPTYSFTIPSSGKKINIRPYTVKEEKNILIAKETGDAESLFESVKNLISACANKQVKIEELTTFDFEMLFLKIRTISVGETTKIQLACNSCNEYNTVTINLASANISGKIEKPKVIELSDTVGIQVSYPKIISADHMSEAEDVDQVISLLASSITSIYDGDVVSNPSDFTRAEMIEFIESLPSGKVEEIAEFLKTIPTVSIEKQFKCKHCGEEQTTKISSLSNFFF